MAEMDPVRWRELSAFLDEALELPSTERLAWLEALRARDPKIAEELQPLLGRLENLEKSDFLEDGPSVVFNEESLAGQTLGAYTIEANIGRGGEERFRREGRVLCRASRAAAREGIGSRAVRLPGYIPKAFFRN